MGRYLSQACEPPRCQNSLVVIESSTESTSRVLLVPAEGGVVLLKLILNARNDLIFENEENEVFVPLLQGCSPVYIHDKLVSGVVYVLCVQQGNIILVKVTVDMENLDRSSSSQDMSTQYPATLDCLSNIEQSPPTQSTQPLLVFSVCSQIVTFTLGFDSFNYLGDTSCPNVAQITSPHGHPGTLLVRCSNYTIYYDLDGQETINMTTPQNPRTPTACNNPSISVTVFPIAGDIKYRLWTTSCPSQQLNIASSKLLSWQCLGDQDQLLFAFTTHQGLSVAQINLTDSSCAKSPTTLQLASANCGTSSCRPLSTLMDQYLIFQASSGQAGDYQVSVFSLDSSIVNISEIRHVDFRLFAILNYNFSTIPSPTPTTSITPTPTTTTLSPGIIAAVVVVPLVAVIAGIIVLGLIYMYIKYRCITPHSPIEETNTEVPLTPLPELDTPQEDSPHHHVHDSPEQ